ncbi:MULTISPECIES: WXG100 family type VII secretion target [Mycobacterium avium complex (MAC)]|nr:MULTISPECIES: WXG100 family type VII secretion target [Mycobacterium avium complex (MAC)]
MQLEAMASAAHILTNQADGLSSELDSIADDWRNLSSTWQGAAASDFQPAWNEWHQGAKPSQRCYRNTPSCCSAHWTSCSTTRRLPREPSPPCPQRIRNHEPPLHGRS